MEIKPERLPAKLQADKPAPVYLVWGDEPLQRTEAVDAIRGYARSRQYTERVVLNADPGFEWSTLTMEAASLSLFATKRLIELRLPTDRSPGKEGAKALAAYSAAPPSDTLLLVVVPTRLDRKTAWFKAFNNVGLCVAARPVQPAELPKWLLQRAKARGLNLDPAAAAFIADRTEGNLLAAHQELERLVLLGETDVTPERLMREIADSARFNVFDMLECALAGKLRCLRMLNGLQQEGADPMAIHGAALWEIRRLCRLVRDKPPQLHGIWGSRRNVIELALKRGPGYAEGLLQTALETERTIKLDRDEGWRTLGWLLMQACGKGHLRL